MIPRILHRIWLGDNPVPADYARFWDEWQALHPGWEFHTWTAADIEDTATANRLTSLSAKSDLLRYQVLNTHGGVYVDTDFEPLRPLDPLLDMGLRAFAAWEDDNRVCTALIGAEKRHPGVEALVRGLPKWAAAHRKNTPDIQTGPVYFTNTWRGRHDVTLLPPVSFYPVSYWNRDHLPMAKADYPAAAFAVHHWGRSWMPSEKRDRDDAAMGRRISFLVPRRSDGGQRDAVWSWLRQRWHANFPQAEIIEGDSDPFNRSESINAAAARATGDVFVIVDADSWVTPSAVREAIDSGRPYQLAWDTGYKLTEAATRSVLASDPHAVRFYTAWVKQRLAEKPHTHLSGCLVVTREAFEAVGGFDEEFRGWGFEDTAFVYALDDAFGGQPRVKAPLVHLWHPPAADQNDPLEASVTRFNELRASRGLPAWRRGIDR